MNAPAINITLHQAIADAFPEDPAAIAARMESTGQGAAPRRLATAFDLVAATPWAMTRDMLETMAAIARRENDSVEAVEARLGRPLQNAQTVTVRDGVAVVPVTGPMFRYANLFTSISGATSLDVLARDFTAALDNPDVSAIVLNIDSPGGQAAGISEFAQMVRAADKPVVAYVDNLAASAAYWIASAAPQVVISRAAELGSIGAVMSYDTSRKANGVMEIVSSQSPMKRADPTSEAGKAAIQARVDKLAQVFIEDVAAYRNVSVDTVLADFGQGGVLMGAEAVAAGMADALGTLEGVIAGLNASALSSPGAARPLATLKGPHAMDLEQLKAEHPQLCADLIAQGMAEGAAAERARIFAVQSKAMPGHEALIATLAADGKTTGAEAAEQVLAAEQQKLTAAHASLVAAAPAPAAPVAAPSTPAQPDASAPVEERCKAKWESDASIRAEFTSLEAFTAVTKAMEAGTLRVLSSSVVK